VFYRSRGSLSEAPHAALDHDQQNGGAERLVVSTRDLDRLVIAVNRFSLAGSFKSAHATIRFEALDDQQKTKAIIAARTAEQESPERWWHAFEVDANGEIRWDDALNAEPPLPT
jgi:hypothetical protein